MSNIKSVTTVEKVQLEGREVGSVMSDEKGFFYRPKGKSGLHNPKWDGEHFPTAKEVMKSVNGDPQATQATAEPVKGAKAGKATSKPDKAPKEPSKAAQVKKAEADTAKAKAEDAKEPANVPAPPVAKPEQPKPEPQLKPAPGSKPPVPSEWNTGKAVSKVRYKLVEATGPTGVQFLLYAGYEHPNGFKWNTLGGFMFLNEAAVDSFLEANGIYTNYATEKVDITGGYYDANKGVVLNYNSGQQQRLL
ncbi:hypothetical protein [Pseudomonas sp. P8_250]|uniref:hypothetical protein n=1 Tax=Pseudomonas sp. P8_250 TaxID=3043446 RepID=UPI002A362A49|nr:hypothetical protein [Pseudomonas sp. P8_250]MDX9668725.1 hypothetical protein [Pseudomonas sp. P8_250]